MDESIQQSDKKLIDIMNSKYLFLIYIICLFLTYKKQDMNSSVYRLMSIFILFFAIFHILSFSLFLTTL